MAFIGVKIESSNNAQMNTDHLLFFKEMPDDPNSTLMYLRDTKPLKVYHKFSAIVNLLRDSGVKVLDGLKANNTESGKFMSDADLIAYRNDCIQECQNILHEVIAESFVVDHELNRYVVEMENLKT